MEGNRIRGHTRRLLCPLDAYPPDCEWTSGLLHSGETSTEVSVGLNVRIRPDLSGLRTVTDTQSKTIQALDTCTRPRNSMVRWMASSSRASADQLDPAIPQRLRLFRPLFGWRHTRTCAVCRRQVSGGIPHAPGQRQGSDRRHSADMNVQCLPFTGNHLGNPTFTIK